MRPIRPAAAFGDGKKRPLSARNRGQGLGQNQRSSRILRSEKSRPAPMLPTRRELPNSAHTAETGRRDRDDGRGPDDSVRNAPAALGTGAARAPRGKGRARASAARNPSHHAKPAPKRRLAHPVPTVRAHPAGRARRNRVRPAPEESHSRALRPNRPGWSAPLGLTDSVAAQKKYRAGYRKIGMCGAHAPPRRWNHRPQGRGFSKLLLNPVVALDYPLQIRHIALDIGVEPMHPDAWALLIGMTPAIGL